MATQFQALMIDKILEKGKSNQDFRTKQSRFAKQIAVTVVSDSLLRT